MTKYISIFLTVITFFVISLIYFHPTDSFDQDLGRHIKLGEIIVQTHSVPKTNLFSYTNPNEPVVDSHWGSQVIFYFIHQSFGINGLILLNVIINTLAFGILVIFAQKRAGTVIATAMVLPFVFILFDRTMIRPEMFGNLFFAFLLLCLYSKKIREKGKWLFPVISLLWINLHISAVLGIVVMGIVLFAEMMERERSKDIKDINVINVIIIILSLAALLINPNVLNGTLFIFNWSTKYGYTIIENQSWVFLVSFGFELVNHILLGILVALSCLGVRMIVKGKPITAEILLFALITVLTLRYVRNEIFFAYSAYLISVFSIPTLKKWEEQKGARIRVVARSMVLVLVGIIVLYSQSKGITFGLGNKEQYSNAVTFFQQHSLHGPLFNNFDIGGYLIYRLYPKEKVFVDNRPEAYPVSFFQDVYIPIQQNPTLFEQKAKAYNFQTIIWGTQDITDWSQAFLIHISQNPNWQVAYKDNAVVIYTKK